jgi:hypothetical protein
MATTQKAPDADSPAFMLYNVLEFLDASPASLFILDSDDPDEASALLESFLSCVISPDEAVQKLACRVARSLFEEGPRPGMLRVHRSLRTEFWMRRYVCLSFPAPMSLRRRRQ